MLPGKTFWLWNPQIITTGSQKVIPGLANKEKPRLPNCLKWLAPTGGKRHPPSAPPGPVIPAQGLIRDKWSQEEDAIASPELLPSSITRGNKVTTFFLKQFLAYSDSQSQVATKSPPCSLTGSLLGSPASQGFPPLKREGGRFPPRRLRSAVKTDPFTQPLISTPCVFTVACTPNMQTPEHEIFFFKGPQRKSLSSH